MALLNAYIGEVGDHFCDYVKKGDCLMDGTPLNQVHTLLERTSAGQICKYFDELQRNQLEEQVESSIDLDLLFSVDKVKDLPTELYSKMSLDENLNILYKEARISLSSQFTTSPTRQQLRTQKLDYRLAYRHCTDATSLCSKRVFLPY